MDVLMRFPCNQSIITRLMETNECFVCPPVGSVYHWISFIPRDQLVIRFQAVLGSNTRIDHKRDITYHLISSCLLSFVRNTNQDILFIYVSPRGKYNLLSKVCRVCWIYDFTQDDKHTIDFISYQSVQHAFNTCGKFQPNVYSTDLWVHHIERKNCTICMLHDTLYNFEFKSANEYQLLIVFLLILYMCHTDIQFAHKGCCHIRYQGC